MGPGPVQSEPGQCAYSGTLRGKGHELRLIETELGVTLLMLWEEAQRSELARRARFGLVLPRSGLWLVEQRRSWDVVGGERDFSGTGRRSVQLKGTRALNEVLMPIRSSAG